MRSVGNGTGQESTGAGIIFFRKSKFVIAVAHPCRADVRLIDFESIECPVCGERFVVTASLDAAYALRKIPSK